MKKNLTLLFRILLIALVTVAGGGAASAAAIAPVAVAPAAGSAPDFGPNVLIFDPAQASIQEQVNAVFKKQESSQFGAGRYALLFKPGKYSLTVDVGFYTQVLGLGQSPDDVEITGAVRARAAWMGGNATCNFWREVENLAILPTQDRGAMTWAVSQATALRRAHIKGGLNLSEGGWSSGGFLADCKVDGRVSSGSQQQWCSRNDQWAGWSGGVWNMVFIGTVAPPGGAWPRSPNTVIEKTPVIAEKPYLVIDAHGHYSVMVPPLRTDGTQGLSWGSAVAAAPAATAIPIEQFYLARPDKDTAATINAALAAGKNLILTPGLYSVSEAIRVLRPGTVVLGLGLPTLMPDKGNPVMTVADVDGVKLCGLLMEAGPVNSPVLLQVGDKAGTTSHAKNPTCLYDIFCRAGGRVNGTCDCMLTINSGDVLGDNFWLWRADHGAGAGWTSNKNANGLIVNGQNVILYGLFVEHSQAYQTIWNGNGGRLYFYQSEMPYDPPSQDQWKHGTTNGYASYKVADTVTTHEAWGLGVYSVFRTNVVSDNAIEAPTAPGIKMHHMVTQRLGRGGGISHVINGQGGGGQHATVD